MLQIALFFLVVSICVFAWIMANDPRTLRSGVSLLWMLLCLAVTVFFLVAEYSDRLAEHGLLMNLLISLLILTAAAMLAFPIVLIVTLFIQGIKLIRHEGLKPTNLLTMACSVLLYLYLAIWPAIGGLKKGALGTRLYMMVSLFAAYVLSLMAVYVLSAALNLFHWKKRRDADYIIVLGAGVIGTRVTPLLAARIDKGIQLLDCNPRAVLIMSGGQGPGEDIPEGEAMAKYALQKNVSPEKIIVERESTSTEENLLFSRKLMSQIPSGPQGSSRLTGRLHKNQERPRVIVVTTAYHVFRALLLARQQGLNCVGFGAKTKWYFTLNALIREFMGYLRLRWKQHLFVAVLIIAITAATAR